MFSVTRIAHVVKRDFFCSRLPSYSRQVLSTQDLKSVIGVTLEIFEIGNDQETRAPDEFCCKARVTQRFRLLEISPTQSRRYVDVPWKFFKHVSIDSSMKVYNELKVDWRSIIRFSQWKLKYFMSDDLVCRYLLEFWSFHTSEITFSRIKLYYRPMYKVRHYV